MPRISRRTLNTAGMRVTNQRSLIIEIIRQGHGHLDADEIHRLAQEKEPRISLSTIYRTLQMLKKLDLVEELHFDEEHHHYEIKPSDEHHHLLCLGCGKVVEFNYPLARYVKERFDIIETEVLMSGYCSQCRQSRK